MGRAGRNQSLPSSPLQKQGLSLLPTLARTQALSPRLARVLGPLQVSVTQLPAQ